ncbi:MAG: lasso RiPP family leader peptide-containing protein [Gemmatimonadota bacterium]
MTTVKKTYAPPQLIVLGTVEDLTQQTKSKAYGGGDDVLVANQAILANLS